MLHSTPPNELDEHDPSGHGLHVHRLHHDFSSYGRSRNCCTSNSAVSLPTHFEHGSCVSFVKRQDIVSSPSTRRPTSFVLRGLCVEPSKFCGALHWHFPLHHNGHVYHSIGDLNWWNLHCPLHCLHSRYLASHRHWHFGDSTRDTL